MQQLDGRLAHGALLVCDASIQWDLAQSMMESARRVFQRVEICINDTPAVGWPAGPNALFKAAAQYVQERRMGHWVWAEPDFIPTKKGWLDSLDREYKTANRPFMGSVQGWEKMGPDFRYMAGCAVYSEDAWNRLSVVWRDDIAFDVATAKASVPHAHNTALIQHFWGQKDLPPTFVAQKRPDSPVNAFTLENLNPDAVVFHRNKDGTLIGVLRLSSCGKDVFAHGGDVGDMIYGLPAMKHLGRKCLVLHKHPVREQWSPQKIAKIAPLLKLQPYISDVIFSETLPNTTYNFNPFREMNWKIRGTNQAESLCDTQLRLFGIPFSAKEEPWLCVDEPFQIPGKPVVIHRSPRYHNGTFPWRNIQKKYARKAVFVGMPDEHLAWQRQFGPIPYHPTADYLELARVIAGSEIFIGNQSCPYAMAEGLKVNAILECFPHAPDCQFSRINLINHHNGNRIILPDV